LASLPATAQHTFGLKRSESLAALFSMVSLAFVSAGLAYEAVKRLISPPEEGVNGSVMTLIAGTGVLVNLVLAWVLGENHVHLPGGDHGHDHSHDHGGHDSHNHAHGHDHDNQKYGHRLHDGAEREAKYGHDHTADDDHDHSHGHSHSSNSNTNGNGHSHDHHVHVSETTALMGKSGSPDNVEYFDAIEAAGSDDELDIPKMSAEDRRNVNLRAAYLHVMADLAQSVAVFVGGVFIWIKPEWHMIDPILTLGFCILVLYNTLGVFRSSIQVLLEEIPPSVNWQKVFDAISKVSNVSDVHDLHIWCISHGQTALSLHCTSSDPDAIYKINRICVRFGINHSTIQVQTKPGPCPTCTSPDVCCTSHLSNRHSSV
jgi:zinc transporter 2